MKPNRLINERSVYLIQHAYNPVDWYPWGEEAFKKAVEEDKPIFLSIGYSSCHWCHVMEKESFRDLEVAKIINENFVPIKVDREERPDIDNLYMNVCMMINGNGGWPLNVFLTPDRVPFFALTYIPKESKYGIVGIKDLLLSISNLWKNSRDEILKSAQSIIQGLKIQLNTSPNKYVVNYDLLPDVVIDYLVSYYEQDRGWKYPKFPSFHNFVFIYDFLNTNKDLDKVSKFSEILMKIRLGGMYDHVGGGFHRYSTDSYWILPHFEKMLYDQAFGILAYSLFYRLTGNEIFKKTVYEVYNYITNELLSSYGGFFSSEDADSGDKEGGFYLWSYEELKNILEDDFELFSNIFNIQKDGNFVNETGKVKAGENILYLNHNYKEVLKGFSVGDVDVFLSKCLSKLMKERKKREKPGKDTKILTDWNSMVIYSLSLASVIFNEDRFLKTAEKCADFIISNMLVDDVLYHCFYDGEVKVKGMLDDYAYLINALLNLYQVTSKEKYLEIAYKLLNMCIDMFLDNEHGGFFLNKSSDLVVYPKEFLDSSYPSGNSVMIRNLITFYNITYDPNIKSIIEKTIDLYLSVVREFLPNSTFFVYTLINWINGINRVVVVGDFFKSAIQIFSSLPTNTVILNKDNFIEKISEDIKDINSPGIYICKGKYCLPPITYDEEIEKFLEGVGK